MGEVEAAIVDEVLNEIHEKVNVSDINRRDGQ